MYAANLVCLYLKIDFTTTVYVLQTNVVSKALPTIQWAIKIVVNYKQLTQYEESPNSN